VLLLVRPTDMRQHAGQIGFPGGMRKRRRGPARVRVARVQRGDRRARDGGHDLRWPAGARELLGHRRALHRRFACSLFPCYTDPREVARVLHVPLRELLDNTRWEEKAPPPTATGQQLRTSPHFLFGTDLLWGLTARFVRDLLDRLRA
jgi:hypothetical protein